MIGPTIQGFQGHWMLNPAICQGTALIAVWPDRLLYLIPQRYCYNPWVDLDFQYRAVEKSVDQLFHGIDPQALIVRTKYDLSIQIQNLQGLSGYGLLKLDLVIIVFDI